MVNLAFDDPDIDSDFVLGWGGFGSPADKRLREIKGKKGLCIGGNAIPPYDVDEYDVLFYETEWYKPQIAHHKSIWHAFGINDEVFHTHRQYHIRYIDWLTVGSYSLWKRHELFARKEGLRLAIGEVQEDNLDESLGIIGMLLSKGCMVSPMITTEQLAELYMSAVNVYIPADINGGGERAVLEARACGASVEIENDNPKLQELLTSPIWGIDYYTQQLKGGILSCV